MIFPSRFFFILLLTTLLASSALAVPAPITTREYATFLNAVAAADPEGLYDEKMGSQPADCRLQATGPETAGVCLIRSGAPGHYDYTAALGDEETPMIFLDCSSILRYEEWLEKDVSIFNNSDPLLRTNHNSGVGSDATEKDALTLKNGGNYEAVLATAEWAFFSSILLTEVATPEHPVALSEHFTESNAMDNISANNSRSSSPKIDFETYFHDISSRSSTPPNGHDGTHGISSVVTDSSRSALPLQDSVVSSSSSLTDHTIRQEVPCLSLETIRSIISRNSEAQRFVLSGDADGRLTIQPNSGSSSSSDSEGSNANRKLTEALHASLSKHYGPDIANDIFAQNEITTHPELPWNAERLETLIISFLNIEIPSMRVLPSLKENQDILRIIENRCPETAVTVKKALTAYNKFAQKNEKNITAYKQLLEGHYWKCKALQKFYRAQGLDKAAEAAEVTAAGMVEGAVQGWGDEKTIQAYEQCAGYSLQETDAWAHGDSIKAEQWKGAVDRASFGVEAFKKAAQARQNGNEKAAQMYERQGHYYLQAAHAWSLGQKENDKLLQSAADRADSTAKALQHSDTTKTIYMRHDALEKASQANQKKIDYLRSASTKTIRNPASKEHLEKAAEAADSAAGMLQVAALVRDEKTFQAYKQCADYSLQEADAWAHGDLVKAEQLKGAVERAGWAIDSFRKAAQARESGNKNATKTQEQDAAYYLRCAEICAQEGVKACDAFTRERYDQEVQESIESDDSSVASGDSLSP